LSSNAASRQLKFNLKRAAQIILGRFQFAGRDGSLSGDHERWPQSLATNQCRANEPSTSRTLQATEQIQNQNDYQNGSDYAVRPVAESITACRESPD
jgi:hypothetical protein